MEDRIVELEIRVAFAEKALHDLDGVLTRYTERVDSLVRELDALRERVGSGPSDGDGNVGPADDPPPHY